MVRECRFSSSHRQHAQQDKTTKNNNNKENENNNSQQLQSDQQTSTSWLRTRSGGGTMVDLSGKEYCHHFRCSSSNNKQHENNDQHQNRTRTQQSWADQTNASMFHHILQSCEAARTQGMNGTLCAVGLVIW